MAGRRIVVGVLCGLLVLLGTGQAAYAKTCMCANDAFASTEHDTPVDIPLDVAYDFGPVRKINIASEPTHGTATATVPPGSDGVIRYVPDPGYVGGDMLTYVAIVGFSEDDEGPMNAATVSISVTGPAPTTTTTATTATTTTTTSTTSTTLATTTTTVAVSGTTVPATTVPTPTTVVAAATLPRTGSTSGGLAALGAAAVVAGSGALALSRRRCRRVRH